MYRSNRNIPYLAQNKIKKARADDEFPLLNESRLLENNSDIQTGYVNVSRKHGLRCSSVAMRFYLVYNGSGGK